MSGEQILIVEDECLVAEDIKATDKPVHDSRELELKVEERTAGLLLAKQQAEDANIARSRFLSSISHDLITPLNPALGYAQILMLDNSLSPAQQGYAGEIHRSCSLLLEKITNLSFLSKLETASVKRNIDFINPPDLIENTQHTFNEKATQKSLQLMTDFDASNLPAVNGDAKLITRLLHLLTDNAIKFSDKGQIRLKLATVSQTSDTATLHFAVEDSGPGISQELVDIFADRSSQPDNSSHKKRKDMGIGLTLSKRIAHYLGGHIGVEQLQPQGSRFWFELTLDKA